MTKKSDDVTTATVKVGSKLVGANAHIVETDATGLATLHALTVLPASGTGTPLNVTAFADGTGGTFTGAGNFSGVVGLGGPGGTGFGVQGFGASSDGTGVRGIGDGNGIGVLGRASGTGAGVQGLADAAGFGVDADATGLNVTAVTIALRATVSTGTGAVFTKTDGTGNPCVAITHPASPARGAINISDSVAAPSANFAGDISLTHGSNGLGRGRMRMIVNDGADGGAFTGSQTVWTSSTGPGHVYVQAGATAGIGAVLTQVATITLDTAQVQVGKPAGVYFIHWSHSAETPDGVATAFKSELQINGIPVQEDSGVFVCALVETRGGGTYTLNALAATSYVIRIMVSRIGDNLIDVDESTIAVHGAFDVAF